MIDAKSMLGVIPANHTQCNDTDQCSQGEEACLSQLCTFLFVCAVLLSCISFVTASFVLDLTCEPVPPLSDFTQLSNTAKDTCLLELYMKENPKAGTELYINN